MNHLNSVSSQNASSATPLAKKSSLTCSAVALFAALGVSLSARVASAVAAPPSCELDCPRGFTCEIAPQACPAIACADDNPDCPRCDGPGTPYCEPAECEADADCGDATVCAEYRLLDCPSTAPAADTGDAQTDKAAEAPGGCALTVFKQCTPRWQLPCSVASDCGDGFSCEETESCSVAPSEPEPRELPPDYARAAEISCVPSGVRSCIPLETPCAVDADCPAQFVCADNPNGVCSSTPDAQERCTPVDPVKLCVLSSPTYYATDAAVSSESLGNTTASLPETATDNDAVSSGESSSAGCALHTEAPTNGLALLSALGLAATFALRRRRET